MNWHEAPGTSFARFGVPSFGLGGPLTPLVRILLAANAGVFVLQIFADRFFPFTHWFGLVPVEVARGAVWQLFTYMFLHGGMWHLLFNLLAIFMFGGEVESELGTKRFAGLYLVSGVGAGVCSAILGWGTGSPVIGASGAIFGILIAFAILFPYRPITLLIFFVVPLTLQARWFVALFGAVELLTLASTAGGGLGQVAHLGGLLFGWIFMRAPRWIENARDAAERRERARAGRSAARLAEERRSIQEDVDHLLEKISREGMDKLTADERRRLVDASERLKRL
jgi:membrane associated rhomboid family serine protease